MRYVFWFFVATIAAAGCRGSSAPASPSTTPPAVTPEPAPTSLRIQGSVNLFLMGKERQLTAIATYVDRSQTAVSPTWTSSRPDVAAIDATGKLTGLSAGSATVIASYREIRDSFTVEVLPDYAGVWRGSYILTSCSDFFQLHVADWCRSLGGAGARLPVTLGLRRVNESDLLGGLTGAMVLGSIPFSVSVALAPDRTASGTVDSMLRANFVFVFEDPLFYNRGTKITLRSIDGQLTGTWTLWAFYDGGKGYASQTSDLIPPTRDPNGSIPDPNAFPAVNSVAEVLDRFKH